MSEAKSGTPYKKHATYRPLQPGMDSGFSTGLSANTLFPEAMDILEMTGELCLPHTQNTLSAGETLLKRFNNFCKYYTSAQIRWVEGALGEIGYYFLMQDSADTPNAKRKAAIRLLKSVISAHQPAAFLKSLGEMKHFCAQAQM